MTLTLDLTPTEEAQITAVAQSAGLTPAEAARKLLTQNLPPVPGPISEETKDPTLALFAQWKADDAQITPEEAAQEQRLWEQFEQNINETHNEETRKTPAVLLRGWLRDEATNDPAVIQKAQDELDEFKRNINANRAATGESLFFSK
jgi:hypothetical protein